MSYGLEVKNSSNKTVFNTEDQFFSALSVNTLSPNSSNPVYPQYIFYEWPGGGNWIKPTGTVYWYDIPYTVNNKRVIHFINIPVGGWLVAGGAIAGGVMRYISSQSTLNVVYAQRSKDMDPPTSSYGVVCYNANGDVCYNPDHPIVHIQGSVNNNNISSDWYSLMGVRQAQWSGVAWRFDAGSPHGVLRQSSTQIYRFLFGYPGPRSVGPELSYLDYGIHADIDTSLL